MANDAASLEAEIQAVIRRNQELKKRTEMNDSILLEYERRYLHEQEEDKFKDPFTDMGEQGFEMQLEKFDRLDLKRKHDKMKIPSSTKEELFHGIKPDGSDRRLMEAIKSLQELKRELQLDGHRQEPSSILLSRGSKKVATTDYKIVRFQSESGVTTPSHVEGPKDSRQENKLKNARLRDGMSEEEHQYQEHHLNLSVGDALVAELDRSRSKSPAQRGLRLKMLKEAYHQRKCKENANYGAESYDNEDEIENPFERTKSEEHIKEVPKFFNEFDRKKSAGLSNDTEWDKSQDNSRKNNGGQHSDGIEKQSFEAIEMTKLQEFSKRSLGHQDEFNLLSRDHTQPSMLAGFERVSGNERWNDTALTYSDNNSEYEPILKTDNLNFETLNKDLDKISEREEQLEKSPKVTERSETDMIKERLKELEWLVFGNKVFAEK